MAFAGRNFHLSGVAQEHADIPFKGFDRDLAFGQAQQHVPFGDTGIAQYQVSAGIGADHVGATVKCNTDPVMQAMCDAEHWRALALG